jgi:hypothetical protein
MNRAFLNHLIEFLPVFWDFSDTDRLSRDKAVSNRYPGNFDIDGSAFYALENEWSFDRIGLCPADCCEIQFFVPFFKDSETFIGVYAV